MEIKNRLSSEIVSEIDNLEGMELGTEPYKATVEGIAKLTGQLVELEKIEREREDKFDELTYRNTQLEEELKDRKIKNGIAIAGILIPTALAIWGTKASFEFEKEGTITTMMGRGFINKLLKK